MLKELIIFMLLVILVVLAIALKDLFSGDRQQLDRSFQIRIGLSIILLVFILLAYGLGMIEVTSTVQFL